MPYIRCSNLKFQPDWRQQYIFFFFLEFNRATKRYLEYIAHACTTIFTIYMLYINQTPECLFFFLCKSHVFTYLYLCFVIYSNVIMFVLKFCSLLQMGQCFAWFRLSSRSTSQTYHDVTSECMFGGKCFL